MPKFFAWPSIRSEKAKLRDTIETVRILAGMAKFFVADFTGAKAVVQELQAILLNLPCVRHSAKGKGTSAPGSRMLCGAEIYLNWSLRRRSNR